MSKKLIKPQKPPKKSREALPEVWKLVMQDMEERNKEGIRKYGTPLQPFNGRKGLIDLYQELLDAAVYCRQLIYEEDFE